MKKTILKLSLLSAVVSLSLNSCTSDNTDVFETNDDPFGEPMVDPTGVTQSAAINIEFDSSLPEGEQRTGTFFALATGVAGGKVNGRVQFTSDRDMRRLYITRTLPGGQPTPFADFEELTSKQIRQATKPDGSIDLDGDRKNAFDFTFELDVPANATDGETIYNFWATSGKGDFRDSSKRLLVGVGTIEVKIGTAVNSNANVLSFSNIDLFAPALDGNTETFFSIFNGEANQINQGPEFRAFWDFGYYYGSSGVSSGDNATLVSANNFNEEFGFSVQGLEPSSDEEDATNETLNNFFFRLSTDFNSTDFDGITVASDLDAIVTPTDVNITNLSEGDIVEFVDNFGNKGLIRVLFVEPGFNNDDFIRFDIKVQPNSPIMDGSTF